MGSNKRELIFISILMVFIFLMGVGASIAFIKTYRREQREKSPNLNELDKVE
jgi:heme/copper-type cytochrome/quinol oxidase subunit 2